MFKKLSLITCSILGVQLGGLNSPALASKQLLISSLLSDEQKISKFPLTSDVNITTPSSLKFSEPTPLPPFYQVQSKQRPSSESDENIFDQINPEEVLPELEPEEGQPQDQPDLEQRESQRQLILDTLSISADRYPRVVNPFDSLTAPENIFSPNQKENYSEFDIRFAEENPLFKQFSIGHFPQADQFYWSMSGNRVVFETQGLQSGVVYQGRTDEIEIIERFLLRQGFFGVQAIWATPGDLSLVEDGAEGLENFQVFGATAELENPEGFPLTGNLEIGNNLNGEQESESLLKLGTGSSRKLQGGGSLFADVKPANAPRIVQGFPTVDLSPLLEGGEVPLETGAILSEEALEETGITFAGPFDDKKAEFDFEFSSKPGVKIGQRDEFDNLDLLSVLVNPFLSEQERNERYLNSLFWAWLGQRQPEIAIEQNRDSFHWHRFYTSYAYNRALLEYDSEEALLTYTKLAINPGLSLSFSFEEGEADGIQSANSSIGLMMGLSLLPFQDLNNLQGSLEEAKEEFESGESLTPLNTVATSAERRAMNQRLDRTLRYGDISSNLEQVSGEITFPSQITPNDSSVLQLRTGLHRRTVEFQQQVTSQTTGVPVLTNTRLSQDDFDLDFQGVPIGNQEANDLSRSNRTSVAEIVLISPDGQQFVEQVSSDEAPLPTKAFALAFDRLEISRIDRRETEFNQFLGYLDLPSIELLWSGSSNDFNYGMSTGVWFNIDPNTAPGIDENLIGLEEPSVGAYLNGTLNWTLTEIKQDEQGNLIGLDAHLPSFRASWNSAINERNPFSAVLSYTYVNRRSNHSLVVSPLLAYVPDGSREGDSTQTDFIGILQGQFKANSGLEIDTSFEIRDELFYDLQALHNFVDETNDFNWAVGAFASNYTRTLSGLSGRRSDFIVGPVVRANFKEDENTSVEARIGFGADQLDVRFEGSISF